MTTGAEAARRATPRKEQSLRRRRSDKNKTDTTARAQREVVEAPGIDLVRQLLDNAKEGTITPKEYAKKLAQTEVDGEINQIKVASETGYRYKGKGMEGLNKLIDDYSKDKTIDLTKKVLPSAEHLKTYEQDAKDARADYIKINGDKKKE